MSGALSVPNSFANAVTATGLQLDNNFGTITAYINDPTNRNNYAADSSGATNTIALSFSPAVTAYTAGLEITFKAALGNTGAVVVNANSLGNKNLFSPAGVALAGGEITANQMIKAAYDGTQFQMISQAQNVFAASAATVSAALSNAFFVTPGRMQNHPGVAKAWGVFNGTITGTQTLANDYNVGTVVRGGVGTYTVSLVTAMANTSYHVSPSFAHGDTEIGYIGFVVDTTSTFRILTRNTSAAAADINGVSFVVYGNQ